MQSVSSKTRVLIFTLLWLTDICISLQQGDESGVETVERRNKRWKRSLDAMYDIVTPNITVQRWNGEVEVVTFAGSGAEYTVTMRRNRDLIRAGSRILRKQPNNDTEEDMPFDSHKHFIGDVKKRDPVSGQEIANGTAAFTQIGGLDGSMFINGQELKVTPLYEESTASDPHLLYPVDDEYFMDNKIKVKAVDTISMGMRKKRELAIPKQFVELMITIENDVFLELGNKSIDFALSSINKAQAIFYDSSLLNFGVNILFTVVRVVVMETNELMTLHEYTHYRDIIELFDTFAYEWEIHQSMRDGGDTDMQYHDVAMVIAGTSIEDNGDDDGAASFHGCHPFNHYLALRYHDDDHTTRILAQQLGYLLGMTKDDPSDGCTETGIMSDVNKLTFTFCNRLDVMTYLTSEDGDCFSDAPNGTKIFEVLDTQDQKLDHDCYLRYAANSSYYSEEVCPWHKTYETADCYIWCAVVDKDLMISSCNNEGDIPTFSSASCGNNKVCDSVLGCICPEGQVCDDTGDGMGLEGVDSFRVVHSSTYEGAIGECVAYGGKLADIRNEDIQIALEVFLDDYPEYDKFFFGLHREPTIGNMWISNGDTPHYFNWKWGEPNTAHSLCAVLSRNDAYHWLDYDCVETSEPIGAVCLIETPKPISYWLAQPKLTQPQSEANCEMYGGRLAKIADSYSQERISAFLQSTTDNVFIGLEAGQAGSWQYPDGQEIRDFNNWAAGEGETYVSGFDCVVIDPSDGYSWKTVNCNENQKHVCEFDCMEDAAWCHGCTINTTESSCQHTCPTGWKGQFCLQPDPLPPVRYAMSTDTGNYTNAAQSCSISGGKLARVMSPEMFDKLTTFVSSTEETQILVNLRKTGSTWWNDDVTQLGAFTAWADYNPGNYECTNVKYQDNSWQWIGVDCSTDGMKYVCEFDCISNTGWCENGVVVPDNEKGCRCECSYTWNGDKCTERQSVKYFLNPMPVDNFYQARDVCLSMHGRLAVIPDVNSHTNIINYLTPFNLVNNIYFDIQKTNGVWFSEDGVQVYEAWQYDYSEEHDCATLGWDKDFKWIPGLCTWGNGRRGLCEFDCTDPSICAHGEIVLDDQNGCTCTCQPGWDGELCDVNTAIEYFVNPTPVTGLTAETGCNELGGTLASIPNTATLMAIMEYLDTQSTTSDKFYFNLRLDGTWQNGYGEQNYFYWGYVIKDGQACATLRKDNNYLWQTVACTWGGGRLSICQRGTTTTSSPSTSTTTAQSTTQSTTTTSSPSTSATTAQSTTQSTTASSPPTTTTSTTQSTTQSTTTTSPPTTTTTSAPTTTQSTTTTIPTTTTSATTTPSTTTTNPTTTAAATATQTIAANGPRLLWVPQALYARDDARDNCQMYGGRLAQITNAAEQTRAEAYLTSINAAPASNKIWFGLELAGSTWQYEDGTSLDGYSNWKNNEPAADLLCAALKTNSGYLWIADDCSKNFGRFHLCEFDCTVGAGWCRNGGVVSVNTVDQTCTCVCSEGWTGTFCLEPATTPVVHYHFNANLLDYVAAADTCHYYGGKLARLQSEEMFQNFISFASTIGGEILVGLHKSNGVWMADVVNQQGAYTQWISSVGSNPSGKDCAAVSFPSQEWIMVECGNARQSVCELDCSDVTWCKHGSIVMDPQSGCICDCTAGWIGEFCEVQTGWKYYVNPMPVTGLTAMDECIAIGGVQADIPNPATQQVIADYINTLSLTDDRIFFDLKKENDLWVNSFASQEFFNWVFAVGDTDNCATIRNDRDFGWAPLECTFEGGRLSLCKLHCSDDISWCHNGGTVTEITVGEYVTCECVCAVGWTGPFCLQPNPAPIVHYSIPTRPADYNAAKAECENKNGRLARVQSSNVYGNLVDFATTSAETELLIGLHKFNSVWTFDDVIELGDFSVWHTKIATSTQECAYVSDVSGNWEWYPMDCSDATKKYVCEFDCDATSWCGNGAVTMDSSGNDCHCVCTQSWTGEFCDVRSDILYWINPEVVNGNTAVEQCQARNGELAKIPNVGTHDAIMQHMIDVNTSYTRIYFDLRKDANGNWVDGDGIVQDYLDWGYTVNDNHGCATIRTDNDYKYKSVGCNWGNRQSICQFECVTDTSWCINGVVSILSERCECVCSSGWNGTLCDESSPPLKRSAREIDSRDVEERSQRNSGSGRHYYGIRRSKLAVKEDYVEPHCEIYDYGLQTDCVMEGLESKFSFNLTENIELVVPSAQIYYYKSEHKFRSRFIKPNHCHYLGVVRRTSGIATVTESSGLAAITPCGPVGGTLFFSDMRYLLHPEGEITRKMKGTHILIEDPVQPHEPMMDVFGIEDVQKAVPIKPSNSRSRRDLKSDDLFTREAIANIQTKDRFPRMAIPNKTKQKWMSNGRREIHLELMVTVNYDVYKIFGDDSEMLALSLINNVQAIYLGSSLYDYGIHVLIHVVKVQVLQQPILEAGKARWGDITDVFMAYKEEWEPKFWHESDVHPEHYDAALLIVGPSVLDTHDDEGLSSFQACNNEHVSVVRYSSFESARGRIAHTIGIKLGLYPDGMDPRCLVLNETDGETMTHDTGIMMNADSVHFTECNRQALLDFVDTSYVQCFDDRPIAEDWRAMLDYPTKIDLICQDAYENSTRYYSERCCPWRHPKVTHECQLWCEFTDRESGIRGCEFHHDYISSDASIPCGDGMVCHGSECVCRDDENCRVTREESVQPKYYKIVPDKYISWDQATQSCWDNNGFLATIPNEATKTALINIIKQNSAHDKFFLDFYRDSSVSNEWHTSFEETVSYFDWIPGEPDDNDHECAVMSLADGYKWKDHRCDGGAGYICEFDCGDTSWCINGVVVPVADTNCECQCNPGFKGEFCREFDTDVRSKFIIPGHKSDFTTAKSFCESRHGSLPSVHTEHAYQDFVAFIASTNYSSQDVYVDLHLVGNIWRNKMHKAPQFFNWPESEPSPGKTCSVVSGSNGYDWISSSCTDELYVVCEFPCQSSEEDWCRQGDVVVTDGSCECVCWPDSYGTNCEHYDYDRVIHLMIKFYETQRSGYLPMTNRIPWRGDSAIFDMGLYGEDLTGGWYDAGDHLKVTFTTATHIYRLAWGLLEFKDAYIKAGELENMYDCLKWGLDWLLKCHTEEFVLYAFVGDPPSDHGYWGRPEEMTMERPVLVLNKTHPGSDVAGNTAAAFAACSLVFRDVDSDYADILLHHARQLYNFSNIYRKVWSDSVKTTIYESASYYDELTNAAIWMYRATNESMYLEDAEKHYFTFGFDRTFNLFGWSSIVPAVQLEMYHQTKNETYLVPVENFFQNWFPGGNTYYTPKGLAWIDVNQVLKHAGGVAFLATIAAKYGIHREEYVDWAKTQVHYTLGDSGRSYVSAFGKNPPVQVHHRASSCPDLPEPCNWSNLQAEGPNPQLIEGAVVGGPDRRDNYLDKRSNWVQNEAGLFGAGFYSAVAGVSYFKNLEN